MICNDNRPRIVVTHKPTGKTASAGTSCGLSMQRQRSMALKHLRGIVFSDDAPTTVVRKYDLTSTMTRIVDTRSGKTIHGDDVVAVLDRGELDLIR